MARNWPGSSRRRRRRGLTLVEAALAMALLGTLLVSLLVATSQMTAQRGRAERRLEACRAIDALLESWWSKRSDLPRTGTGYVSGHPDWTWRTSLVPNEVAKAIEAEVVAVEVFVPGTPNQEPAARVEILLPPAASAAKSSQKAATERTGARSDEQPRGTYGTNAR